jgi:hypothetical protein
MEIFPKLFVLPQVNDGCRFLAAFIHHERDSAHGNNLAEKCAEANSKTNDGMSLLETGDDFFSRAVLVWSDSRNISSARLTAKTQRHKKCAEVNFKMLTT